jgi:glycine cleavage system transcriptional repressor
MSTTHMVLTAVGPDRPGLVRAVSAVIHRAGANLEDSRMAVLAGEFALIVLLSGSDEALHEVRRESARLERELDFSITFRPTARRAAPERRRIRLEVTGADQPGIVHEVGRVLEDLRVNVCSLESRLQPAAFSGVPLFLLQAELEVPGAADLERLQSGLEAVCEAMQLDYSLEPLDR